MPTLVFVYGTLKAGYPNSLLLKTAKRVGDVAVTVGSYFILRDTGRFPVLMKIKNKRKPIAAKAAKVVGEVYEVDDKTLQSLDYLEGNGRMYQRKQFYIHVDGRTVKAWIYVGMTSFWRPHKLPTVTPSADGRLSWVRSYEPFLPDDDDEEDAA